MSTEVKPDVEQPEAPKSLETSPETTPEAPPAKKMPDVESVRARITQLEKLCESKITAAEAEGKNQIEAVRADFHQQQKAAVTEIKKIQQTAKTDARKACKAAIAQWARVLKSLEADKAATEETPEPEADKAETLQPETSAVVGPPVAQ